MPAVTFVPQVEARCPFCQGRFSAGYDSENEPGVIHSLPTCKRFDELEPDAYLQAVREKVYGLPS